MSAPGTGPDPEPDTEVTITWEDSELQGVRVGDMDLTPNQARQWRAILAAVAGTDYGLSSAAIDDWEQRLWVAETGREYGT